MTGSEAGRISGVVKYQPVLGQATSESGSPYSVVTNTCVTDGGPLTFHLRGERAEDFAAMTVKGSSVELVGRWHEPGMLIVDRFDVDGHGPHSYSIDNAEHRGQSRTVDIGSLYDTARPGPTRHAAARELSTSSPPPAAGGSAGQAGRGQRARQRSRPCSPPADQRGSADPVTAGP